MLWVTLWNKLGKQPMKITAHNNVCALLWNPKTRKHERVDLELRFDEKQRPYFVERQNYLKDRKAKRHSGSENG